MSIKHVIQACTCSGEQHLTGCFQYMVSDLKPSTAALCMAIPGFLQNTVTGDQWEWNPYLKTWVARPRAYRVLLTQNGGSPPAVTVLESTLPGVPIGSRTAMGIYNFQLLGKFPRPRTALSCSNPYNCIVGVKWLNASNVEIQTRTLTGILQDSLLNNTLFQILLYPETL